MTMRQSSLRIRRVRFKDGRAPIEVFAPIKEKGEDWARQAIENVLTKHLASGEMIAGLAVVVWSPDMMITGDMMQTGASPIPSIVIPELVRASLQKRLTRDQINDELGRPESSES